jgi:hypothetical protein
LCHGRVRPRAVQRHVRVEYLVEHAAARVKGTYLTGRKPTETTNRPASWPESNSQVGPLESYHGVTARIALSLQFMVDDRGRIGKEKNLS